MDSQRRFWNEQQKALRQALALPGDHPRAIKLFLDQHAMVHPAEGSQPEFYSFDDPVWQGLPEGAARRIPRGEEHSLAWIFWHLTRIEDMTMNVLLAGRPQLLRQEGWQERLRAPVEDTGNAMAAAEIVELSQQIDIDALRAYRQAVSRGTREVVMQLKPEELKQNVDPARLQQLKAEGAVVEAASGLLDYWSGLTLAGLLLMPPTRHSFVHLTEAMRIKRKLG